jgi:hypothetical protein
MMLVMVPVNHHGMIARPASASEYQVGSSARFKSRPCFAAIA